MNRHMVDVWKETKKASRTILQLDKECKIGTNNQINNKERAIGII